MCKWGLRSRAEPNHARRHSKRASFPGGKTARFPLPALNQGDRAGFGAEETLAGECNEMFVKAAIALDAKKAMLKQAALEVVCELLAHK